MSGSTYTTKEFIEDIKQLNRIRRIYNFIREGGTKDISLRHFNGQSYQSEENTKISDPALHPLFDQSANDINTFLEQQEQLIALKLDSHENINELFYYQYRRQSLSDSG